MSLGLLQSIFNLEIAILICAVLFFASAVIALLIDEGRGRASATRHEGE